MRLLQVNTRVSELDPASAFQTRSETHPYKQTPMQGRLAALLAKLPAQDRAMLEMVHFRSLPWLTIAKELSGAVNQDERELARLVVALRQRYSRLLIRLEKILAEDARARFHTSLATLPELERRLLTGVLWERQPWLAVCSAVSELALGRSALELRRCYRAALKEFTQRCRNSGLLPHELLDAGVLCTEDLPRAGTVRSGRRHRT